jgi:hypothetical protein
MDNEFRFYAILLIFGKNFPYLDQYSVYKLDVFKKYKDIKFDEIALRGDQNRYDIRRTLHLCSHQFFIVDRCYSSNRVGNHLSFIDKESHINVSDSIFLKGENNQNSKRWGAIVNNKIEYMALLLHSIYFKHLYEIPLLIHTFPHISASLLGKGCLWLKN